MKNIPKADMRYSILTANKVKAHQFQPTLIPLTWSNMFSTLKGPFKGFNIFHKTTMPHDPEHLIYGLILHQTKLGVFVNTLTWLTCIGGDLCFFLHFSE